ncbi:glutathione peroxidase [soil metagenome]
MTDLANIPFDTTEGTTSSLAEHHGEVVLIVNVASKCGLTPQYEALQKLYADKRADGLTVLGFPANDFAGHEPGTDAEIAEVCELTYAVEFPILSKISVVGAEQHPLYGALTEQAPPATDKESFRENLRGHGLDPTDDPDVLWNFEKFLVDKQGAVVGRFSPAVAPDDPALVAAIDAELAK